MGQQQKNPLSLIHLRVLRAYFMTIGAWPTEAFGTESHRKTLSKCIIIILFLTIFGEINYIVKKVHLLTFLDIGDLLMTLVLTIITFIRSILPATKSFGRIIRSFIMEFHLVHYKHKGEYYKKICNKINKWSHYFTMVILGNVLMGPLCFNIVPLYNNYINGAFGESRSENYTLQFSVYFLFPIFSQEDHLITSTILNSILSYFCSILICAIDILTALMAFQIIGHIKILLLNLKHMSRPKQPIVIDVVCKNTKQCISLFVETYDSQENELIRGEIVKFVEHHKTIDSFAGAVSQFFGPMLALNYLYQLLSCALLLLECSGGGLDTAARYLPLTILTFYQLIQMSLTFEIIGSESSKLKDAVYNIPWECMNISNQKLVFMFLTKIQIPIRVTALGMADVGVKTMTSILKTTFSYFAILQTMNE